MGRKDSEFLVRERKRLAARKRKVRRIYAGMAIMVILLIMVFILMSCFSSGKKSDSSNNDSSNNGSSNNVVTPDTKKKSTNGTGIKLSETDYINNKATIVYKGIDEYRKVLYEDLNLLIKSRKDKEIQAANGIVYPLMEYPVKSENYVELNKADYDTSYISVISLEDNKIIAGINPSAKLYPASMTKVMTLIVAVEHINNYDEEYVMPADIVDAMYLEKASVAGFNAGESVKTIDMLYGVILPSGADAALGVARMVADSESHFVELMNEKCEELGLKNTHFANPTGLFDESQYTTATEMCMILAYAMKNPICAEILSTYQYTTSETPQHPEGILLQSTMFTKMYGTEPEVSKITAGKSGYTIEAGQCLVCYGDKDEKNYVAVMASGTSQYGPTYDAIKIFKECLP